MQQQFPREIISFSYLRRNCPDKLVVENYWFWEFVTQRPFLSNKSTGFWQLEAQLTISNPRLSVWRKPTTYSTFDASHDKNSVLRIFGFQTINFRRKLLMVFHVRVKSTIPLKTFSGKASICYKHFSHTESI